jgi:hypothetical protein
MQKNNYNEQILLTVTDTRQIRPLVREGSLQRQDIKIQAELISDRKPHSGLDTKTYWLTVSCNVIAASVTWWVYELVRGIGVQSSGADVTNC